jgi:phospholipid transport system substrate-binding protein
MRKSWFLVFVSVLLLGSVALAATPVTDSPVTMLQQISNSIIGELKKAKASLADGQEISTSELHRLIKNYFLPHADLDGMSRAVIGRADWDKATSTQRQEFEAQFTNLVINTYASALKTFDQNKIKFYDVRGGYQGKSVIQVNSSVSMPNSDPLTVVYYLQAKNGRWYVTDLSVEGISLVQSYQAQFGPIIAQNGMDGLISMIKQSNERLSSSAG